MFRLDELCLLDLRVDRGSPVGLLDQRLPAQDREGVLADGTGITTNRCLSEKINHAPKCVHFGVYTLLVNLLDLFVRLPVCRVRPEPRSGELLPVVFERPLPESTSNSRSF